MDLNASSSGTNAHFGSSFTISTATTAIFHRPGVDGGDPKICSMGHGGAVFARVRSQRWFTVSHVALSLSAWCAVGSLAKAQPSFEGIGDLPGGIYQSEAFAVSADGTVVVGYGASTSGTEEAFRWTNGVMTPLGDLVGGGFKSHARSVSGDGLVIVGMATNSTGSVGFRWENDIMQSLGVLPGRAYSWATVISRDGMVVAGNSTTGEVCCWSGIEACVWVGEDISALPDLAGGEDAGVVGRGISRDGSVIVGSGWTSNSQHWQACRWNNGVPTGLGYLPGGLNSSSAYGVSGDGSVVVGDLPGGPFQSFAIAVSDDGGVIVGKGRTAVVDEAFIWDETHEIRRLQDVLACHGVTSVNGWTLDVATGISADGEIIVGRGINPSGNQEGWVARVPRAPVTIDQQPSNMSTCPGGTAMFTISLVGNGSSSYQWRKAGIDLGDGPTGDGSTISGATTANVTIIGASAPDAGSYDCVLTCGSVTSDSATLTICHADYTCDGFVDGIDSDQFNNDFESTDPEQQIRADYNGDGFVDGIDYDQFNNDFETGC